MGDDAIDSDTAWKRTFRNGSMESEAEYIEYRKKRNFLCFGYSPHTLDKLLSQILPIAEFMLLIIVLVMFLQVAPSEMARTCDTKIHQECLEDYSEYDTTIVAEDVGAVSDNGFEVTFTQGLCGKVRVMCWRSGLKDMIYQDRTLADNDAKRNYTTFYNSLAGGVLTTAATGIPVHTLSKYGASIKFCHCMLSSRGADLLPTNPDAFRSQVVYFCDAIVDATWILGGWGLVSLILIVWVKALVDYDNFGGAQNQQGKIVFCTTVWLIYSVVVVVILSPYTNPTNSTQCELPDSNILFYIFLLAVFSMLMAAFALVIALSASHGNDTKRRRTVTRVEQAISTVDVVEQITHKVCSCIHECIEYHLRLLLFCQNGGCQHLNLTSPSMVLGIDKFCLKTDESVRIFAIRAACTMSRHSVAFR
eukprot:m.327690 g.327690  ORF g.327690 m.327690 type:complete len:419 (+) comp20420_c0_seq8:191-1447(+)